MALQTAGHLRRVKSGRLMESLLLEGCGSASPPPERVLGGFGPGPPKGVGGIAPPSCPGGGVSRGTQKQQAILFFLAKNRSRTTSSPQGGGGRRPPKRACYGCVTQRRGQHGYFVCIQYTPKKLNKISSHAGEEDTRLSVNISICLVLCDPAKWMIFF